MDGIAPGIIAITSFFLAIICLYRDLDIFLFFILLSGFNFGFLVHNFHPARIYLGDNGSLSQGYLVAVLIIEMNWGFKDVSFQLLAPVMLMAYPILDTSYVCFSRILNSRKPWIGDTNHTSHKIMKLGHSIRKSSLVVYFLTTIFCITGLALSFNDNLYPKLLLLVNILIIIIFVNKLNKVAFQK